MANSGNCELTVHDFGAFRVENHLEAMPESGQIDVISMEFFGLNHRCFSQGRHLTRGSCIHRLECFKKDNKSIQLSVLLAWIYCVVCFTYQCVVILVLFQSVLGSGWWGDLFWTIFVPYTNFHIRCAMHLSFISSFACALLNFVKRE